MYKTNTTSFLKWAGGKRRLVTLLDKLTPTNIDRYFEPFLGSGAFFFYLIQSRKQFKAYLSDSNPHLINTYREVRDNVNELIEIHTSKIYRVYMLGFLPGFAYMGEVDEKLEMPRKQQPRQRVEAGSVGIAGKQTGIYPFSSPGGWQIIGQTALKLFDAGKKEPTLLKAGDKVKFISITVNDFYEIQNSPSPFMERGLGGEV